MSTIYIQNGQSSTEDLHVHDSMYVFSGGTAYHVWIYSGGEMYISAGGVANYTKFIAMGDMYVYSGGIANDTTVNSGGWIEIDSGGVANRTTVDSGGYMHISSGGLANSTIVDNVDREWGFMIAAGGEGRNTTVKSDGGMTISPNGKHTGTLQIDDGALFSTFKGIIDFTVAERTVEDDYLINNLSLISGTPIYTITVSAEQADGTYKLAQGAGSFTGSITIGDGTTSYGSITVNGEDFIYNDTTYSLDQVNGNLTLSIAKIPPSVFIYSSGTLTSSGTVIDGAELISGGNNSMHISSGGVANSTTVNSGGRISIFNDGVANSINIYSSGFFDISKEANASDLTIYNGGRGDIYGSADQVAIAEGGYLFVISGAYVTNLNAASGADLYLDVAPNTYVNGASGGASFVIESGVLNNYECGTGHVFVENGGRINHIFNKDQLSVQSGGYVESAALMGSDEKIAEMSLRGSANDLTLFSSSLLMIDGGSASNLRLDAGELHLYNGGTFNTCSASKGVIVNGITLGMYHYFYNGKIDIHSGEVNDYRYALQCLNSGHTASNLTINSGGDLTVYNGVVMSNTQVNSGGNMLLGGLHKGSLFIENGGSISAAQNSIIDFTVSHRTTSDDYLINNLSVISGTPTYTITVSAEQADGTYKLGQGAEAFTGSITIGDGTTSYGSITVNGEDFVYEDTVFSLDQVNGNLTLTVQNKIVVSSGSIITDQIISSGGSMSIVDGGIASETIIESAGKVTVSSGGTAINTVVSSGASMFVNSSGTAIDTTIESAGTVTVSSGGKVIDTVVSSGGNLYLSSGSIIGGENNDFGGNVIVNGPVDAKDAVINFAMENRTPADGYIISNIGNISNADFSITVSATQEYGTYKLAQGAENFNETVTIGDRTDIFGSLTVNGEILHYNGVDYQLTQQNGNLHLSIGDFTPPAAPTYTVSNTALTNQNVTVSAAFSLDSVVKQFSLNGKDWETYTAGIVFSANGKVSFRSQDAAGNISEVTSYEVTNIDKVAPTLDITANKTAPTNQNVILTATVSDGTVEYFANGKWNVGNILIVTKNGTYQFRVTDAAGNSVTDSIVVNNIDKVAPTLDISVDKTTPTNQNVVLTATVSDGTVEYYDGKNWVTGSTFEVTANGTYQFRVTDAAGNSVTDSIVVNNIDKVAPTLDISVDKTTPTNQNVVLTATVSDGTVEYYDGKNWVTGSTFEVTANGTYQFRVTDAAGNSVTDSIVVNNIDKVAPTLDITANKTALTNQNVILTATVSDGTVEYYDGKNWVTGSTFEVSANGTYQFKVTDAAGNITERSYEVSNIDKIAPDKPVANADITSVTSDNVTVSATFAKDSVRNEYSLNGKDWLTYSQGIVFDENGTVYFRSTDLAGNVSTITSYSVTNIDQIGPDRPVTSADILELTNQNVTVSATFSPDSVVKQFSLNGKDWENYSQGVVFEQNGTVYFRSYDGAGNVSPTASYNVANIDKVAPTLEVTGNATEWTNEDVILTANVSDGVVEYFDNGEWVIGNSLTVSENGTYQFRVTDLAGNVTTKEIVVDKIDKIAPTLEVSGNATAWTNQDVILTANVSDGVVEYFDGKNWVAGSTLTVSENGTYTFRVTDEAGNVTEKEIIVDKIDKVAPTLEVSGNATEWTNQDVILTANVSDGVVEYFDGENWIAGSTLTVSENGTYQFRVTDLAGNVTEKEVVVDKIDKVAPTLEVSGNTTAWTNKDVVLTANVSDGVVEYFDGKSWIAGSTLTATENGTYQFRVTDLAGNVTTKEIVVDKIDKVAPTLEVSGNATEWTNQDVILTANVSDGVVEYFDGENWVAGSTLTATENGTYQFRVTDEAGNVTEKSVEVTFIDKDAPVISEISADITELTNSAIKVSALFNDSNNFSVQYRINDGAWLDYNDYIIMENNGIVYFKAEDIAGNVTEAQYIVSNIDRTTAEAPVITVEKRAYLSNNPLIVTAEFAENAVTKEYSFNGIDWISYAEQVIVRENGFIFFRSCDAIGNYSVVGKAEVSGIDHVADSSLTDYVFVKSNYTEKNTKNKKQNGIMLTFSENAFNTLADFEHSAAYKVVMLDNNINIFAATDLSDLSVISGVAAVPTVKKKVNSYSYSAKANARGTLNIIEKNTDDVLFKDFANVNIYGNAIAGIVDGGKSANSQTIKTSVKKAVTTVIETNKVSQTASGKANVNGAFVKTLSNYATVNIESGTVENIVNNAYKLTKNIKNVGGNNSEIKYTEQFTASGTVKLTNGAHTDTISNYKTVKITDSNVGKIESFAVSKIVNGAENRKLAGSVTLLRASVDTIENYAKLTMTDSVAAAVANVRKIAVNKGFSSIENYIGTSENDTLTIGKNAVLVLSGANFGIGSDKIVNSGTLIFASDFVLNAEKIINKGNFAATSDVWENLNGKIVGLLNLGQTYEGFRNVKYELADNTAKKAVKWDLKSDYTGWLSGDSDCIDTVDFVKFKTGKESSIIEISGFSGSDTISLVDKKGNVAELTFADGVFKAELAAKTDYILELGISKGDDSMSYTLAVV